MYGRPQWTDTIRFFLISGCRLSCRLSRQRQATAGYTSAFAGYGGGGGSGSGGGGRSDGVIFFRYTDNTCQ